MPRPRKCPPDETVREHYAHGGKLSDAPLPDEDLTTPEHLLHLPARIDAGEIGARIGRAAAAYVRQPATVAGLSGNILRPLIVFRGRKVPFVPYFIVALMGEAGGRMAWRSYKNLETIARTASEQVHVSTTPSDA